METMTCPLCSDKALRWYQDRKGPRAYNRCRLCDLVFLDPSQRMDPGLEKARYEHHNNDPQDLDYRNFLAPVVNAVLPFIDKGANGLDFGSGPGPTLSVMFEEKGYKMNVYDPYFAPDKLVLMSNYDFITCTEVIEHVYEPSKTFALFNKLLNNNGVIAIMTENLCRPEEFSNWWYRKDETHVSFYSRSTFEWLGSYFHWTAHYVGSRITLFHKESKIH